jgi:FkbM family methyltransferase
LSVRAFNNENRDMTQNGEVWLMGVAHDYFRKKYDENTVFDVGANIGDWALQCHSIWRGSRIHCFELVKKTSRICESNVEAIDQIKVLAFGLSDKTEQTTVFLNGGSDVTSFYRRVGQEESAREICDVVKGDDYVRENAIERISFLKIDAEGSEHLVLDGLENILRNDRIDLIQFEYGEFNLASRMFLRDFYEKLENFHLGRIFPKWVEFSGWHKDLENFKAANYVAVRKDLSDLKSLLENR